MSQEFKGKVVLITGAAVGIGRAITLKFVEAGLRWFRPISIRSHLPCSKRRLRSLPGQSP